MPRSTEPGRPSLRHAGGKRRRRLPHSIGDVGDDGRAAVSPKELLALLDALAQIARDAADRRDRDFATRIVMRSGEPGWRPSVPDLMIMRQLCADFPSPSRRF
jgi:hypothetical protein